MSSIAKCPVIVGKVDGTILEVNQEHCGGEPQHGGGGQQQGGPHPHLGPVLRLHHKHPAADL